MSTKFKKGKQITSVMTAIDEILVGNWLYLGNKPISPAFMVSQSLWTIKQEVAGGRIFEADKNEEGK